MSHQKHEPYAGVVTKGAMSDAVRRAYGIYMQQRGRCNRSTHPQYVHYGARGIRVEYSAKEFIGWYLVGTMAQKCETIFKQRIRPHLNRLPRSMWYKIQQVSVRGVPDFLGCVAGRFVALELKASAKHKVDALQAYNLQAIDKAGGVALTVFPENWDATYAFLQKLSAG